MTPTDVANLIDAAKSILLMDRHWSLHDCADRAEAGKVLAEMIVFATGAPEDVCPKPCAECRAHKANCGEE